MYLETNCQTQRAPQANLARHLKLSQAQFRGQIRNGAERETKMKILNRAKETAAAGYILLWLLGIPIPILLLIFLLRGCT